MKLLSRSDVFGTRTRTNILEALVLLEESHASELARILGLDVSTVQNSLDSLEQANLVVGAYKGTSRRVCLNPQFFARQELEALLTKLALNNGNLLERTGELRRRPRRVGKKL